MAPPVAFNFEGEVAIVTGAGSRMPGMFLQLRIHIHLTLMQVKLAMGERLQFFSPARVAKLLWLTSTLSGRKRRSA